MLLLSLIENISILNSHNLDYSQRDKGRHFGRQLFIVTDEALDAVVGSLVARAL